MRKTGVFTQKCVIKCVSPRCGLTWSNCRYAAMRLGSEARLCLVLHRETSMYVRNSSFLEGSPHVALNVIKWSNDLHALSICFFVSKKRRADTHSPGLPWWLNEQVCLQTVRCATLVPTTRCPTAVRMTCEWMQKPLHDQAATYIGMSQTLSSKKGVHGSILLL